MNDAYERWLNKLLVSDSSKNIKAIRRHHARKVCDEKKLYGDSKADNLIVEFII